MRWEIAAVVLCARTAAGAPWRLAAVHAPAEPITFVAPAGWSVKIERVRAGENEPLIVSMSPQDCDNLYLTIALDPDNASPSAHLDAIAATGKRVRGPGMECAIEPDNAVCARTVVGYTGVMQVWFAGDEERYRRLAPAALVEAVAASLRWHGDAADLRDWERRAATTRCTR